MRVDDGVRLYVDGKMLDGSYEDAKPFADGWAAVKQHGKWGFINTAGEIMIDFQYDNALSFGQHLAAVQQRSRLGIYQLAGQDGDRAEFPGCQKLLRWERGSENSRWLEVHHTS